MRHGHASGRGKLCRRSPTYNSWRAMIERCTRSAHPFYSDYGGRGIRVCDRWLPTAGGSFGNFLADLGARPDGLTLDRLDVDGDYTPRNCRWATKREQTWNRRVMHERQQLELAYA